MHDQLLASYAKETWYCTVAVRSRGGLEIPNIEKSCQPSRLEISPVASKTHDLLFTSAIIAMP